MSLAACITPLQGDSAPGLVAGSSFPLFSAGTTRLRPDWDRVSGLPPGAIVIHDDRNQSGRIQFQELRRALLAFAEIHHVRAVGQSGFFEGDGGTQPIGGRCEVQVDHAGSLSR
jgi:hypothetical protein